MNKILLTAGIFIFFSMCSTTQQVSNRSLLDAQTFVLTTISSDPTYGFSEKNPIQVGGVDRNQGPLNERRFLNALAGPNGEAITYFRARSCCPVKSKNDPFGFGSVMLDDYRVSWEGAADTVSIFINMYDYGPMEAPVGFTIRGAE